MTQFCDKHQTYYCYADNKLQCSKCHAEAQAVPAVAVQAEGSQAAQFAHDSSSLPSSRSAAPPCERIAEIRAREQTATEGPWRWHDARTMRHLQSPSGPLGVSAPLLGNRSYSGYQIEDHAFIAHARQDIPWLLAQHATLIAERDEAKVERFEIRTLAAEYGWTYTGSLWEWLRRHLGAMTDRVCAAESALDEARKARDEGFAALASAMRKMLPASLLAEVAAHLDPLTPFVEFLRGMDPSPVPLDPPAQGIAKTTDQARIGQLDAEPSPQHAPTETKGE